MRADVDIGSSQPVGAKAGRLVTREAGDIPRPLNLAEGGDDPSGIERLGLVDAGERTRYVTLVVDVLREYIAERVSGAPLSMTSTELLAVTQHARTLPHDRLLRILNEADLVKFARRPVSAERARDIGREARAIVEHEHIASQPVPESAEEKAA